MTVTYDSTVNALSVTLAFGDVADTIEIEPMIVGDVDAAGHPLGVEFVHAEDFLPFLATAAASIPACSRRSQQAHPASVERILASLVTPRHQLGSEGWPNQDECSVRFGQRALPEPISGMRTETDRGPVTRAQVVLPGALLGHPASTMPGRTASIPDGRSRIQRRFYRR